MTLQQYNDQYLLIKIAMDCHAERLAVAFHNWMEENKDRFLTVNGAYNTFKKEIIQNTWDEIYTTKI